MEREGEGHREEKENSIEEQQQSKKKVGKSKLILAALVPLVVLTGMIAFLLGPGQSLLLIKSGIPLPEISIERIEFQDGKIMAFIRNTGPMDVTIAQADINDRIQGAAIEPGKNLSRLSTAKVIVPFIWNPSQPYEVGITTSDGVRFHKNVEAAGLAPTPDIRQASFFAIIGTYVGIIPVMIGFLWFPFIKRLSNSKYVFFLSLTVGLLVFLGLDALIEGNKIATENVAGVFNGQMLIAMVTIVSFLALMYVSNKLVERANTVNYRQRTIFPNTPFTTTAAPSSTSSFTPTQEQQQKLKQVSRPAAIALMISIGIGLHNLGEGLAIGAAVLLGKVALSTFLIVGFALHNTTEGIAIVAPLAKATDRVMMRRFLVLGVIAGSPAILGIWIGGFLYSPIAAIFFLAIGAGAIFQVAFSILLWISNNNTDSEEVLDSRRKGFSLKRKGWLDTSLVGGFIMGMVIMYATSLLVAF
jgi:ZIP family zinc transporter